MVSGPDRMPSQILFSQLEQQRRGSIGTNSVKSIAASKPLPTAAACLSSSPDIKMSASPSSSPSRIYVPKTLRIAQNAILSLHTFVTFALSHSLNETSPYFTRFNAVADELRKSPDWKGAIEHQIKKFSTQELARLASIPAVSLRGFDREVAQHMLSCVKTQIETRENWPRTLESVENVLASLETEVIKVDQKNMKVLGGGAVNTVYSVTYRDADGNEAQAVFKPDPAELGMFTILKEQGFGTAVASGIPPGLDGHLPSRAVASSVVDRLLYNEETISVRTRFAIVNGQRGILMDRAQGKSPQVKEVVTSEITAQSNPKVYHAVSALIRLGEKITPQDLQFFARESNLRKVEIVEDSKSPISKKIVGTTAEFERLNPKNPATAEGLLKLQVKDWITGECDRHPGNYFIDDKGKVTGIDEDCCFGVNSVPAGVDVRSQPPLKLVIPNNGSLMLRLPPVVTSKIKDQITDLYIHRGELKETLQPYISAAEIDATVTRLETLHEHVSGPNCLVVETTDELLSNQAFSRLDTNNSYLARELFVYAKDEKGWNYLRAHRNN